ncbi:potassium channel family protein [Ekhidna sp.]|uniref:potassium channel family protein n=1 Tax=Ekhidna sp. TaxID=2608089 RepID=UPI003B59EAC0
MEKNRYAPSFANNLLNGMSPTIILVGAVTLLYVYLMQFIDHKLLWVQYVVLLFAMVKALFFTFFTIKQIKRSIFQCYSLYRLIWIFGLLVSLIIFSFASDFVCLSGFDKNAFAGIEQSGFLNDFFEYFYFSTVTFASIGYGDIVPVSGLARVLVIMEIGQSFILIVFGLSNINNMQIDKN